MRLKWNTSRISRRIPALAGLAVAIVIIMLIAYPIRVANQRAQSVTNLKQIGKAMQVYQDAYKRFPADIRGRDGEAPLSWRVRILPFLGYDSLFGKSRLDEPWDSPHHIAPPPRGPRRSRSLYTMPAA